MFEQVQEYAAAFWGLLAEMSPYLWAGIVITFFLKWFVNPALIQKYLGGDGFRPVVLSTLAGLPLPLCSCGVLPVAAAIRREGGGRAGVAAFTVSTPQTGVDSILATAGLLGWGLAVLRLLTAFVSGLLSGLFVGLFAGNGKRPTHKSTETPTCCEKSQINEKPNISSCCGGESSLDTFAALELHECAECDSVAKKIREACHFAFLRLPADIGVSLLVGTALAALVLVWMPDVAHASLPGGNLGTYALVSLIALPVYVCSTGVIPLAFGLIAAGFPAGAAFILLTAGPSVSATSLVTLGKLIGWRATIITAATLLVVTWSVGSLIDFSPLANILPDCSLHEISLPAWRHFAAAALLCLLVFARIRSCIKKN